MSGLCGCIHWTNRPGHAQAAAQMADAAAYRGPDGIEAWSRHSTPRQRGELTRS